MGETDELLSKRLYANCYTIKEAIDKWTYRRARRLELLAEKVQKRGSQKTEKLGGHSITHFSHYVKNTLSGLTTSTLPLIGHMNKNRYDYKSTEEYWTATKRAWEESKMQYREVRDILKKYFELLDEFPEFKNAELRLGLQSGYDHQDRQMRGLTGKAYITEAEKRLREKPEVT